LPGTRYTALARETITAPKEAPLNNVNAKAQLLVDQGVRPDIAEKLLTALPFATRQVLSRHHVSNGRWHHVWPVVATQFRNRTNAG
jgi:hypothetical protein